MSSLNQPLPVLEYLRPTPQGLRAFKSKGSQSNRCVIRAAQELGVEIVEIAGSRIYALTYKGETHYLHFMQPDSASEVAYFMCLDKVATRALLDRAAVSISKGFDLNKQDQPSYWDEVFDSLQKPLVIKPTTGQQGQSIFMGVETKDQYHSAVQACFEYEKVMGEKARVLVEETFTGTEYRVLATRDKVIGIINRQPANVIGDGKATIQQLIEQKNADPRRSDDPNDALIKIKVDSHVQEHLASQGLTIESVPALDQKVYLRRNSNISTGGDSIDVTDIAHPSVQEICVKAVQAIPGLQIAGIDFMTKDIAAPQTNESYIIIEVNASPGIIIHEMPYSGKPREAGKEYIYLMFPELRPAT